MANTFDSEVLYILGCSGPWCGAVAAAARAADLAALADDPFAVVTYCVWPYNMQ